jgi:hypothetical protein
MNSISVGARELNSSCISPRYHFAGLPMRRRSRGVLRDLLCCTDRQLQQYARLKIRGTSFTTEFNLDFSAGAASVSEAFARVLAGWSSAIPVGRFAAFGRRLFRER